MGGRPPTDPHAILQVVLRIGLDFCCCFLLHSGILQIFTQIICRISILGTGRFSAVFSVKRHFTTSGVKAGKWQVGRWIKFGVWLSLLLLVLTFPVSNFLTYIDSVWNDLNTLSYTSYKSNLWAVGRLSCFLGSLRALGGKVNRKSGGSERERASSLNLTIRGSSGLPNGMTRKPYDILPKSKLFFPSRMWRLPFCSFWAHFKAKLFLLLSLYCKETGRRVPAVLVQWF